MGNPALRIWVAKRWLSVLDVATSYRPSDRLLLAYVRQFNRVEDLLSGGGDSQ